MAEIQGAKGERTAVTKLKVDFAGFEQMREKLNRLGANTKVIAEDALKATNELVYAEAKKYIQAPHLPAGGKYSRQEGSEASLRREPIITWNGNEAEGHMGFDMKQSGIASILLIRGTPRMPKVQGLYNAFFGQTGEIQLAQKEVFEKALREIMGE